jgi:hypothetical protein
MVREGPVGCQATGHTPNISSPHQTPALRHRASTGQLNQVAYPGTPVSTVQTLYPQWNQSPNISPYWHPALMATQYQNYNQEMAPPAFPVPLTVPSTPTPSRSGGSAPKKYTKRLNIEQKLSIVFDAIDKDAHWSFSKFLYYTFRVKDSDGKKLHRTKQHATTVSHFLAGRDKYFISHILASWMQTPDGRPQSSADDENMYSPSTPFLDIGPARPAITSFAVQLVGKKLTQEHTVAVRPSSGLHAPVTAKSADKSLGWDDVGLTTVADVTEVLKKHQPLIWHYLIQLTTSKARQQNSEVTAR